MNTRINGFDGQNTNDPNNDIRVGDEVTAVVSVIPKGRDFVLVSWGPGARYTAALRRSQICEHGDRNAAFEALKIGDKWTGIIIDKQYNDFRGATDLVFSPRQLEKEQVVRERSMRDFEHYQRRQAADRQREDALARLRGAVTVTGVVAEKRDFGVFVDLELDGLPTGWRGLLHVSKMKCSSRDHRRAREERDSRHEALQPGHKVEVVVEVTGDGKSARLSLDEQRVQQAKALASLTIGSEFLARFEADLGTAGPTPGLRLSYEGFECYLPESALKLGDKRKSVMGTNARLKVRLVRIEGRNSPILLHVERVSKS